MSHAGFLFEQCTMEASPTHIQNNNHVVLAMHCTLTSHCHSTVQ